MRYILLILSMLFVLQFSNAQNYGVFSEDASITESIDIDGGAATIKNIKALNIVVTNDGVYEGTKAIQLTYDFSDSWAMMQIIASAAIDLSSYANGYYNFAMKTTTTETFNIRITDNVNKPQIVFAPGADPYGFERDGEWHMISIPISDFIAKTPALNLSAIMELLVVRVTTPLSPTSSFNVDIDNIYFSQSPINNNVVASPLLNPIPASYVESVWVKMSCATSGAVIHYTLDGTDPSALSPVLTDSIQLTETKTVKAVAIKDDVLSTITSGTYTITEPVQVTDTYAIYTQDAEIGAGTSITSQVNNLFVISTISEGTYEGSEALAFTTDLSKDWAMATIKPVAATVDISAYSNGYYNLAVKSTSQGIILFRLQSSGQKAIITFDATSDKYGFKRDGEWHFISIPMADFKANNASIDLTKITDILVLRSDGDIRLAGNYDFYLDNIYLSLTLPEAPAEVVASPVISPAGGSFTAPFAVSISTVTSGASIYYTLDGTTPTAASTLYSGSFNLTASKTVKAIAIKGAASSDVTTSNYTVTIPETVLEPVFTPVAGNYNDSVMVSISTATSGASLYYTIDGSSPTAASTLYSGSFKLNNTSTVKAVAIKNNVSSSISSVIYTVNVTSVETVEAPVFAPTAGEYSDSVWVAISSATEGATIYYTVDGTEPSAIATSYTGSFKLAETATVKAIAIKNSIASAISSATYTINTSVNVNETFAIYTQDNAIAPGVDMLSASNNLFVVSTISTGVYEGDEAISLTTDMSKDWAMATLKPVTPTVDISGYANGYYNFAIKSSSTGIILVRLQSAGQKAIIVFDATSDFYGFKRDGGWHLVSIPVADFMAKNASLDLTAISDLMVLRSDGDIRLANNYDFFIDNFYLSLTKPSTTEAVRTPVITPVSGSSDTPVQVSISTATIGATVYYTIDGSAPTTASSICSGSFELSATATVKAVAVKNENVSSISEATYTITQVAEVVETPMFSVPDGEYADSVVVTITSATEGAQIYYTVDGTEPTISATLYVGEITLKKNAILKAIAIKEGVVSEVSNVGYTFWYTTSSEFISNQLITVYPNPATGYIVVSAKHSGNATIYDINGREVMPQLPINKQVDISGLLNGIYFINVTVEGKNYRQKFVKF